MLDFEKVFQDNQGFIFRYLMKLCGNESLAEELTQESFFRAYMNLTGLRKEEKVTVWLCQIAKNTYFAWYNEQKKLQPLNNTPYFENTQDLAEAFVEKELSAKAYLLLVSLLSKALLGFYRILFCAGHIWENKEEYE
ncbi:MAG: hypothetical protein IJY91_02380 [Oscillospiraceae bacterium]|nr:hypothetical protein [Oscillospiraceae bacterium]